MKELDQIAKQIVEKEKPVRLPGLVKKRKETLEQFLIKFFTEWNDEKDTVYVEKVGSKIKIGHSSTVQTGKGKRRSIGDVYLICKYYYPFCTLKEVTDLMYGVLFTKMAKFRSSICSTINKRVFYVGDDGQNTKIYNTDEEDEYGMTVDGWKKCK